MPHYKIEYGRAPDGLFSMVGFQPPLSAEHATAVEGAVDDFLSQETIGSDRLQAEPIVDTYHPQTGNTAIGIAEFEADGRNI